MALAEQPQAQPPPLQLAEIAARRAEAALAQPPPLQLAEIAARRAEAALARQLLTGSTFEWMMAQRHRPKVAQLLAKIAGLIAEQAGRRHAAAGQPLVIEAPCQESYLSRQRLVDRFALDSDADFESEFCRCPALAVQMHVYQLHFGLRALG